MAQTSRPNSTPSEPTAAARKEANNLFVKWAADAPGTAAANDLIAALAAIIQARMDAEAVSGGRSKALNEKAEEARREWKRAESAEAEVAALLAVVRWVPEWDSGDACGFNCGGHKLVLIGHFSNLCPDCGHKPACPRVTTEWFKEKA